MPQRLSLSDKSAVLFDVDGTLLDSMDGVVQGLGDASVKYFGYRPRDESILSLIGKPVWVQLETFAGRTLTVEERREMTHYTIEQFEVHKDLERPYEAAIETLRVCHRAGRKTALVTSKSATELVAFLSRFSGADAVDTCVCSDDVNQPKPAPDSALLACERLGVRPEETVFIGDSVFDLRCARSAGIPAVAVTYGAAPKRVLIDERPDLIFDTPEALLEWAQASLLLPCPERS